MRLSDKQRNIILEKVSEVLGKGVKIALFGSRVDDEARGGDIDILVESDNPVDNVAYTKALIEAKLSIAFKCDGIDVLLMAPNIKHSPIHNIAKETGICL
jgi:predicted nucleotidyltransferase